FFVHEYRQGRISASSTTPATSARVHATVCGGARANSPTASAAPMYWENPAVMNSAGAGTRFAASLTFMRPLGQGPTTSLRNTRTPSSLLRVKGQRHGVHAKTVARGSLRGIVEDVPEVGPAIGAQHLGADHSQGGVGAENHCVGILGLVETRPPAPGVEFGFRPEQLRAARAAGVDALAPLIEELACEGAFRACLPQDMELHSFSVFDTGYIPSFSRSSPPMPTPIGPYP